MNVNSEIEAEGRKKTLEKHRCLSDEHIAKFNSESASKAPKRFQENGQVTVEISYPQSESEIYVMEEVCKKYQEQEECHWSQLDQSKANLVEDLFKKYSEKPKRQVSQLDVKSDVESAQKTQE